MRLRLLTAALLASLFVLVPKAAQAAFNPLCPDASSAETCACYPGSSAAASPACQQAAAQTTKATNSDPAVTTIKTAANLIALITGVAAVIIIVYSGFVFATAGGGLGSKSGGENTNRARQARSALTGALIGLAVVALAWTIVTFVTDRFIS